MSESAFDGTVLEGRERRYTVINERDFQNYVPEELKQEFDDKLLEVCDYIEPGRIQDGKQLYNSYIVINIDEPYIGEIIEVMERHGHFNAGGDQS